MDAILGWPCYIRVMVIRRGYIVGIVRMMRMMRREGCSRTCGVCYLGTSQLYYDQVTPSSLMVTRRNIYHTHV